MPEPALFLEIGCPHGDAQGLHLGGAGYDAAVVVGEDRHGAGFEVGSEEPLAGGVKVVAVAESEHYLTLPESMIP